MAGTLAINELLKSMQPELKQGEYIFCCFTFKDDTHPNICNISVINYALVSTIIKQGVTWLLQENVR